MVVATSSLSPRRRRTRERRLEEIVAAALDIIESDSLDALTMARLAGAVDLTPGALYRYFASKDVLIATLQARTIHRIAGLFEAQRAEWMEHLPADREQAALCELVATSRFYLDLASHDARGFRLIAATLGDPRALVDDEHAGLVATPLRELILHVSTLFAAASERGVLAAGSAPLRTIVFWTSLHGVVSTAKLDRLTHSDGWFAPARLAEELTTSLLVGWGASIDAVTQARCWLADHPTEWTS